MTRLEIPSTVAVIVGRVQVDGAADLAEVHDLQDQITLRPLHSGQPAPAGLPVPDPAAAPELAFWEQLRVSVAAFPPPPADAEFIDLLAQLGITAEQSLFVDPDAEWAAALAEGQQQGQAMIDKLAGGSTGQEHGPPRSTCSTTTWIGSGWAPSTTPPGRSPTERRPMSPEP